MDYELDIELSMLVGCDGSGKSTAYDQIKKESDKFNTLFYRFPSDDIRFFISQIPQDINNEYPLMRHKLFEVDFHNFFKNITDPYFLINKGIEIEEPIKILTDRLFPCNMAYGLYHLGVDKEVYTTLDFIRNFINKLPNTNLQLDILHVTPNIKKWYEKNGEEMSISFLNTIENCYENVYNYLQENYTEADLEAKGITSLKISKFFNNYNGVLENEIHNHAKIPKI